MLATRIFAWIAHFDEIVRRDQDDPLRRAMLTSLVAQLRHLARTAAWEAAGAGRLRALKGLIAGMAVLGGPEPRLARALKSLERELSVQILPDGGHLSRSPSLQLQVLQDLIDTRAVLRAAQIEVPAALKDASNTQRAKAAAGQGAALAISVRLERLKEAASRVAAGTFDQPIGDESPDEVGQVARSFDLMQARLAQVDRARKDFIANASHELRTPLFSLGGFLELLAEEDLDPQTRAEFVQSTREQVSRLTKLASDLLDLSRLDSGAVGLAREPVDLSAAARMLVREFRGLGARHGSRIVLARSPTPPARGMGDEERVQQIGRALLDNAVRHTPPGTNVRVAVESENGIVRLAVSDDGPGIDPRVRDHLFERFSRGPETTAAGSGLGLAIADELAQRMGGSIVVDSANGLTRFALVLPAEPVG